MMTDPIADMLTRIRNAQRALKRDVVLPYSDLKRRLAEILSREGYVGEVSVSETKPKMLIIELKYDGKMSAIRSLRRESRPGYRMYRRADELPTVASGYGIAIVSTPLGLMTNKEARKAKVGGEVVCSVY